MFLTVKDFLKEAYKHRLSGKINCTGCLGVYQHCIFVRNKVDYIDCLKIFNSTYFVYIDLLKRFPSMIFYNEENKSK